MTYLLDVNVWLALAVAEHIHCASAREWLESIEGDEVSFCRITQMGFLRLLTNPRVLGNDALTAAAAWKVFDTFSADSRVVFTSEPGGFQAAWREAANLNRSGPNFWTDAYLAAFATVSGFTLVSFDRGLASYRNASVQILG